MITITKPEQVETIDWQENEVYYIYGKIGAGKTHLVKEIVKQYKKKVIYTDFSEMIQKMKIEERQNQEEKGVFVIDDDIKKIMNKEFISYTIEKSLRNIQKEGNTIMMINTLKPKELEGIENPLAKFLLSSIPIEICYDEESRRKIAEEYSKQCHTKIQKETLKSIVEKEENLGKIKGTINLMSIQF